MATISKRPAIQQFGKIRPLRSQLKSKTTDVSNQIDKADNKECVKKAVQAAHKKLLVQNEQIILTSKIDSKLLEKVHQLVLSQLSGESIECLSARKSNGKRPQHRTFVYNEETVIITGSSNSPVVDSIYTFLTEHFAKNINSNCITETNREVNQSIEISSTTAPALSCVVNSKKKRAHNSSSAGSGFAYTDFKKPNFKKSLFSKAIIEICSQQKMSSASSLCSLPIQNDCGFDIKKSVEFQPMKESPSPGPDAVPGTDLAEQHDDQVIQPAVDIKSSEATFEDQQVKSLPNPPTVEDLTHQHGDSLLNNHPAKLTGKVSASAVLKESVSCTNSVVYSREDLLEIADKVICREYPSSLVISQCEILSSQISDTLHYFKSTDHKVPSGEIFIGLSSSQFPGTRRHSNDPLQKRYTSTSDPRSWGDSYNSRDYINQRRCEGHKMLLDGCFRCLNDDFDEIIPIPESCATDSELDQVFQDDAKCMPSCQVFTSRPKESHDNQYIQELLEFYESQGNKSY